MLLPRLGAALTFIGAALLFGIYVALPSIPRWTILYVAAASIGAWWAIHASRVGIRINRVGLAALIFMAWQATSLLWSPDPFQGLEQLLHFAVMAAIAVFVSAVPRQEVEKLLPHCAAAALLGAMIFNWKWPQLHGGFGNPNFLAEFVIIAIPLAVWDLFRPDEHPIPFRYDLLRVAALVWGLWHLIDTESNLKFVAVAVWLALWAYHLRRAWFVSLVLVLVPINLALLMGWVSFKPCGAMGADVMCSLQARLEVWANTAVMWWHFPVLGTGFGGFNYWYPLFQEAHRPLLGDWTVMMPVAQFAGAAHNEILQTLAELGLVGLALAIACLLIVFKGAKTEGLNHPAIWTLVLAAVLSMGGFPLHTPSTGIFAASALGVLGNGRAAVLTLGLPRLRLLAAPVALAWGLVLAVAAPLSYKAEMLFSVTQAKISSDPLMAFWTNAEAARLWPLHSHYRHQLLLTLRAVTDFMGDKAIIEREAADRAYQISRSASPYNPGIVAAWVGYLLNSGRQNEPGTEELLTTLKAMSDLQAVTWMVEAVYAISTNDEPRARFAVGKAYERVMRRERQYLPEVERLVARLNQGVSR